MLKIIGTTSVALAVALGASTVQAQDKVDIDALVAEILAEENTDLGVHTRFQDTISQPSTPFNGNLDEPVRIGWTSPGFDLSDAWERYYLAASKRLEDAGIPFDINLQAASRHDAHDEQFAHVEAFITQGVDYIVLGPTELEAQGSSIRAAHAAGIPLIIVNHTRRLDWDDQTLLYTSFDHEIGGVMTGEWIQERFPNGAKIGLMRIVPGDMDDHRWGGAQSVLEASDAVYEVVSEEFTHADRQRSFDIGENMLIAHPDIDLLFGLCSACALGAVPAISAMGLNGEVQIIGFGGIPEETELMQAGTFNGSVFRYIDDLGVAVVEAIKHDLEGRRDEIPAVHTGGYIMMDDTWSADQFQEVNEYAIRYSSRWD